MAPKSAVDKAQKAVNAAKHGVKSKVVKRQTCIRFHRPKTLRLVKSPKVFKKLMPRRNKMDDFRVLKMPLATEKALRQVEQNVITFLCDMKATKPQIADAISRRFGVKVQRVNTLIRPDCQKKAYIKLAKSCDASELASKLGLL